MKRVSAILMCCVLLIGVMPINVMATNHTVSPVKVGLFEFLGQGARYLYDTVVAPFMAGFEGDEKAAYDEYVNDFNDENGAYIISSDGSFIMFPSEYAYGTFRTNGYGIEFAKYTASTVTVEKHELSSIHPPFNGDVRYTATAVSNMKNVHTSVEEGIQVYGVKATIKMSEAGSYTLLPWEGYIYSYNEYLTPYIYEMALEEQHIAVVTSNPISKTVVLNTTARDDTSQVMGPLAPKAVFYHTEAWIRFKPIDDASWRSVIEQKDNRMGSIESNFGYIVDGVLHQTANINIVNEDNKTYYNPYTDESVIYTEWSYDYSTRQYDVVKEDGEKASIVYGDEYITIREGDMIYNVYYMVPDEGGEAPVNPNQPHEHTYTLSAENLASCVLNGDCSYICSGCGDIKTDVIYTTGHKWGIKQQVLNEYDAAGNLVTNGYTIFRCSVCGQEQRSDDGTAPPGGGGSGGGIGGTGGGVFALLFEVFAGFMGFFADLFGQFVVGGIGAFLGMIANGAGDIFSILNPFSWLD